MSKKRVVVSKGIVMVLCSLILAVFGGKYTFESNAAASFSNSTEKAQLFAVPNGGWSTITAKVMYSEEYSPVGNGTSISLNRRDKSVLWRREYATTSPTVQILNIKHSNGKVFNNYTKEQTIYGAPWQGGSTYVNTEAVVVSRTGGISGNLPFILACSGGVPASVTGSVSLTFK